MNSITNLTKIKTLTEEEKTVLLFNYINNHKEASNKFISKCTGISKKNIKLAKDNLESKGIISLSLSNGL
jgi:hypothetical protein